MRATRRFLVAFVGLLASILEFAGALVRLATAVLERAARRVAPRVQPASMVAQPTRTAPAVAPLAAGALPQEERLQSALVNMGFKAGSVRAFTASVRGSQKSLEALVKEGIVDLSAN
jgi:hypothetical protein